MEYGFVDFIISTARISITTCTMHWQCLCIVVIFRLDDTMLQEEGIIRIYVSSSRIKYC